MRLGNDIQDARFVGPHERLLFLRSLPQAVFEDPDFQMAFALRLRERTFRRGSVLSAEGEPPRMVHFLVEGRVTLRRRGHLLMTVEPPFAVGFLHTLAQSGESVEMRAEEDTITLAMSTDEIWVFLEENFGFLRSAFSISAKQLAEAQHDLERRGRMDREPAQAGPEPTDEPLDLVQRIEILTGRGPYAEAALDAVVDLAEAAEERRYPAGDVLWSEGEASAYGCHLVSGIVRCRSRDGQVSFRLGAGDVIGHLDAFGGLPRRYDAVAETPLLVLRMDTETIFDVLEEEFALGQSFLGFMNRILLDLYEKLARVEEEEAGRPGQRKTAHPA
ncbi:MAG TPA: cyclic nucleotide-binding domain-containing protein [Polyangiaceae bacterium LLY-WYZ-14_1]|nr:cyclic nucleotide-binding domain-containing protein [Polyangiaceae bacterium LLY-WYZ-14_1]